MTQDEIIADAKEAGGTAYTNRFVEGTAFAFGPEALKRFVNLVEARATDKANARANASWTLMCEKMVAIEREACAQVAFSWNTAMTDKIAEEIRARGQA